MIRCYIISYLYGFSSYAGFPFTRVFHFAIHLGVTPISVVFTSNWMVWGVLVNRGTLYLKQQDNFILLWEASVFIGASLLE